MLDSINKRLAAKMAAREDQNMDIQPTPSKRRTKTAHAPGTKVIGVPTEPKLYARILRFKEKHGISSLKKAVIVLCDEALSSRKIY
jgi:hypothetical protein